MSSRWVSRDGIGTTTADSGTGSVMAVPALTAVRWSGVCRDPNGASRASVPADGRSRSSVAPPMPTGCGPAVTNSTSSVIRFAPAAHSRAARVDLPWPDRPAMDRECPAGNLHAAGVKQRAPAQSMQDRQHIAGGENRQHAGVATGWVTMDRHARQGTRDDELPALRKANPEPRLLLDRGVRTPAAFEELSDHRAGGIHD